MKNSQIRATYILVKGGHAFEAVSIANRMKSYAENTFITFKGDQLTRNLIPENHDVYEVTHTFQEVRRCKWSQLLFCSWKILPSYYESIKALLSLKPDVVISTGSGPALIPMLAAKTLGIKVIFIESACRIHSSSLCGKVAYRYLADRFFVQWHETKTVYPNSIYAGRLF